MSQKKYIGLNTLKTFLDNLKVTFSSLSHTHSYDELRNKPFYEGQDYSSILTNGVSTINFYDWGGNVYGAAVTDAPKTFTQDVSHKVIWDNVEYTMTCIYGGDNEAGNPITSLGAPYGDYSVYPFGIDSYKTADGLVEYSIHTKSTSSTHTIDVLELGTSYVTLDEKFIPQSIYTEFDTIKDAKADWNQTDENAIDYIKNRTHWSKSENTVFVEEEVNMSLGVHYFAQEFSLNIGQTYTVVFDGTTYECVAFYDGNYYNSPTIGGSYYDYSTYPFTIFEMSPNYVGMRTSDYDKHTVKVSAVIETIQKLDEKYIPDTYVKTVDMEAVVDNVEDTLSNQISKKANISDISSGFNISVASTMNTSNWKGVVYANGKYTAVGSTNFAYSTDGINWTYGTLPFYANGIAYGNGMYCVYGYSEKNVCYSTDGINWNTADTGYNSNKFSIHYLNGKFFISAGYAILSSSDCVNWSVYELDESCTLYGGAYGNGVYILSGYGDVFISTNGTSWTKITTLSTTETYSSIFYVDGRFIAIAHGTTDYKSSNKIAYSTDGRNWTYGTLPITAKWVDAGYYNGMFLVAGYTCAVYSNDGVNWETASLPEGWTTIDCMCGGNEFLLIRNDAVAVGRANPYDLVFKPDIETINKWEQIYDSGNITSSVNAFANIDIKGYKKLMIVVKCVNDGTNSSSKNGSVTFTSEDGTTYQFPCWTTLFTNANYTSGGMAIFEISDGWLICPNATRILNSKNFLGTEGGTADNLNNTGSGIMRCTNVISKMMISPLDQDTNYNFLAGSRVIVWGCK